MDVDKLTKLIKLIMALDTGQINDLEEWLNQWDLVSDHVKMVIQLFLTLTPEDQKFIQTFVKSTLVERKTEKALPIIEHPIGEKKASDEILVSDVKRNEQVNVVALSRGKQTILCSDFTHGAYYALWPMVGDSDQFDLSSEGDSYQRQIRKEYDDRLDTFPRKYVAVVYAYSNLLNNTVSFWEDMRSSGLFPYWDPENGPYRFYEKAASKELQMLRSYEIDKDLKSCIEPNKGYRNAPVWIAGYIYCDASSVLTNDEMDRQLLKFNEILKKHGNPPAKRA